MRCSITAARRTLDRGRFLFATMLVALSSLFLSACVAQSPNLSSSDPQATMQYRQMQTRIFDTTDEKSILIASAALLQDMGFNIDESESALGLLVASKQADATDAGQVTASVIVALLGGGNMPVDREQTIRASIVTTPHGENKDRISVRVTFQREVINDRGAVSRRETIQDLKLYQGFFDKLSQSVFLEANEI